MESKIPTHVPQEKTQSETRTETTLKWNWRQASISSLSVTMDLGYLLSSLIPSLTSVSAKNKHTIFFPFFFHVGIWLFHFPFWVFYKVGILSGFFIYLAIFGSILPGKVVPGVTLSDGTRLHYRCNGENEIYILKISALTIFSFLFIISHFYLFINRIAIASFAGLSYWGCCKIGHCFTHCMSYDHHSS